MGRGTWEAGEPRDREEKEVSHGWESSQEGFDGRGAP